MISLLKYIDGPWEAVRGYLKEDLEHIQEAINQRWYGSFNGDGNLLADTIQGDPTPATRYVANTGTDNNPKWDQVNLVNGVKGRLGFNHLPTASSDTIIGRGNGNGDFGALDVGNGLTIEASTIKAEAFPVGSVYQTVSPHDPSSLLGYGDWELLAIGTASSPGDPIVFYYQ